ncbi:MAG: hypothetical protein OXT68_08780 [Chloroflexota bacterium]|nr:hypothetical protein [Chloroflexota bacterium]
MSSDDKSSPEMPEDSPESSSGLSLPPELFEAIPEGQRDEVRRKLGQYFLEVRREEHYSGPLQPFREAAGWNELVPGSAERSFNLYEQREIKRIQDNDRILTIVEERARHDMDLETKEHNDLVSIAKSAIKSNSAKVRQGQWIGFVGALLLFAGGIHLVNLGESLFGVGVFIFEIAAFAGVYVNETRRSQSGSVSAAGRRIESPSDQAPN